MTKQKSAVPQKVLIQDSDEVQNIFVQMNLKDGSTMVLSNYSAWDNLAYLMEALGVTAAQCISEGIPKVKVYEAIKSYMMNVLEDYKIIHTS